MEKEKLCQKFNLQVKTDLNCLEEILQWFKLIINPLVSERSRWQCEVALTEAFTNIVRHAHRNLPSSTPIDIEVELYPHLLEIRLWDFGYPFDFFEQLQTIRHDNVPPLEKEGGRGLQFMAQLTDELQYTRIYNNRNCLLMRKKIE